jgi:hypothetical protein
VWAGVARVWLAMARGSALFRDGKIEWRRGGAPVIVSREGGGSDGSRDGSDTEAVAHVRFLATAQGPVGHAHGGAVGLVFADLARELLGGGAVLVRLQVDYVAPTPLLLEHSVLRRAVGSAGLEQAEAVAAGVELVDAQGRVLSRAVVVGGGEPQPAARSVGLHEHAALARTELFRRCVAHVVAAYPDSLVAENQMLPPELLEHLRRSPEPQVDRRTAPLRHIWLSDSKTPGSVFSHFDFHLDNKMNVFTAQEASEGGVRFHSLLLLGERCLGSSPGHPRAVCPGALYAAVDDVMGSAVVYTSRSSCFTAAIDSSFVRPLALERGVFVYVLTDVAQLSPRKYEARSTVMAIPGVLAVAGSPPTWAAYCETVAQFRGLFVKARPRSALVGPGLDPSNL